MFTKKDLEKALESDKLNALDKLWIFLVGLLVMFFWMVTRPLDKKDK